MSTQEKSRRELVQDDGEDLDQELADTFIGEPVEGTASRASDRAAGTVSVRGISDALPSAETARDIFDLGSGFAFKDADSDSDDDVATPAHGQTFVQGGGEDWTADDEIAGGHSLSLAALGSDSDSSDDDVSSKLWFSVCTATPDPAFCSCDF